MILLSSADFFKISMFKKPFRNTFRVSNSLNPNQARHYVWPDLGPIGLQKLSADEKKMLLIIHRCLLII